uniref:Uncharacterized protein n=1 Tax=Fundulus heteroclitus TaxID=8078 RepID=A0A3Q2T5F5_FUNHE
MDRITLPKLQDEDRELCDAEISSTEVLQAIKSLQNNKTPGPDGFPVEPLSLLNADYTILSKLIALRLEDVIPKIIHADQTGFVKNRHKADNVCRLLHILKSAKKRSKSYANNVYGCEQSI